MIDERYIELMSAEIDGVNSPTESEELQRLMAKDPAAQRYYQGLQKSIGLIEGVEDIAAPEMIPGSVMASLDENPSWEHGSRRPDSQQPRAVAKPFRSYLKPGYAWAFAAGLAAGLLVFAAARVALFDVSTDQHEQFYGEMRFDDRAGAELTGSPWQVDDEGFLGTIILRQVDNRLFARITGDALVDLGFEFHHGPEVASHGYQVLAGPGCQFSTAPTLTSFAYQGVGEYLLLFAVDSDISSPLTLEIVAADHVLAQREFGPVPP